MATWQLPPQVSTWIDRLSQPLHGRLAWRLLPLVSGMLFAQGRRTVASWLRAADLGNDYKAFYRFLGCVGRRADFIASQLLRLLVAQLPLPERLLFALDDTPTKRDGPHVEGAGIHHNPTPGPADHEVSLWPRLGHARLDRAAPALGDDRSAAVGPAVRSRQEPRADRAVVRQAVPFRTKLELAADLVSWLARWLRCCRKPCGSWPTAPMPNGRSSKPCCRQARSLVEPLAQGRCFVEPAARSRPGRPRQRGRTPKYGKQAISLAKRAGHRGGWQQAILPLWQARPQDVQDLPGDVPGRSGA